MSEDRKKAHIDLALKAHSGFAIPDQRFTYEPLLSAHPVSDPFLFPFMGRVLETPIWISSMTGGTPVAGEINRRLATVCHEFGMGMGLGSCRMILKDNQWLHDFDVRDIIGENLPLYANLGINQVEEIASSGNWHLITELIKKLRADGLIIHINPLQEWMQPEGDRLKHPPLDTLSRTIDKLPFTKLVVKEVGQGMGPESLKALLQLPLEAIEFGAYGGTNFSRLEIIRNSQSRAALQESLATVGHNAEEMVHIVNNAAKENLTIRTKHLIISGGIASFLDGYYLTGISHLPAVYGQASAFLQYAREGLDPLRAYTKAQTEGLRMAASYLRIKK